MKVEEIKGQIAAAAAELGIWQYGIVPMDQVQIAQEVRDLCAVNYCGMFGKSWACPPGVGTLEECEARVREYQYLFVYTTKHEIEDSFDFEGMMDAKEVHEKICAKTADWFCALVGGPALRMSGEGCSRCASCTYPDAPCRFPEELSPSPESLGIRVNELAASAGVNYINGVNTVTYFGCVAFERK